MLYLYGTDAENVYMEEFEEIKDDPETYTKFKEVFNELEANGLS